MRAEIKVVATINDEKAKDYYKTYEAWIISKYFVVDSRVQPFQSRIKVQYKITSAPN